MNLRNVTIDKTARIEELLKEHLAVCLIGLPGTGKKTAVRILLEKHPEINPVYCSVEEIENLSALEKRKQDSKNWYLIRKPQENRYPDSGQGFWRFIQRMPGEDRIFLAADGMMPESFLEFVWNGIMAAVLPESFWFTEAETYRYLKECRSSLHYREVQYLTGGWAGCIAMLVRLEKQLGTHWTAWELCSRYEIRRYIREKILKSMPAEELRVLKERAAFSYLNRELSEVLWEDPERELEERLFARGAMVYVPGRESWHVQPALRIAVDRYTSQELCGKAVAWYEEHGRIQDALACCWYRQDKEEYRDCLIRNYDKISFLNYDDPGRPEEDREIPELFYIRWMDAVLRQDTVQMKRLRQRLPDIMEHPPQDEAAGRRMTEICLNIAYTDPEITAKEWMELLREKTDPEHPVRLYYMLGESVSYLSGIRDLSELFACEKKEREKHQRLWEERLDQENHIPYRLARMEYDYQTDAARVRSGKWLEDMPETAEDTLWQIRLGVMYLAYLFADGEAPQDHVRKYIREMATSLANEESQICRWNARALYYLAEARWGEKEDLMRWIRETGGDIGNDAGKTRFYLTAEVKINMYLGNYSQAESILQTLIPYFEKNKNRRWLAETLFQRAIAERERGENGQALKTTAESLAAANPCRYVRLYTGYGKRGAELLEEHRKWIESSDVLYHQKKKKYKYGSVLKMPLEDWIDYIIRKAGRQKKHYLDLTEDQQNIYRVEKLTVTELMVLRYLEKGYSNAAIGETMNIRLSTVKSHIYNIYKKLGVTTRIQAVQKARETGILQD